MSVSLLHRLFACNLGSFDLIVGEVMLSVFSLLLTTLPLSPSPTWATGLPRLSGELSCPPGYSEAAPGIHSRQQQVQRKGLVPQVAASFSQRPPLGFALSVCYLSTRGAARALKCHCPGSSVSLVPLPKLSPHLCK